MSGNLTRINNNQITDAVSGNTQLGINANTKVQPYSITSTLLANNLTYGSDLTVTGNLSVTGNVTAIDTTNTTIEDPLLLLASTQTGSPTVDIGYIGQRGTSNNIAFVWQESSSQFITAFTNSGAGDNTVVNVLSYADFKTANANVIGNLIAGNVSLNGNVTSPLNVTGNIAAGNIYSVGLISATGNIATAAFFKGDGAYISNINAGNVATYRISNGTSSANIGTANGNMVVTINGNLNSTFYDNGISATGNITSNAALNGNTLSLSGNVTSDLNVTTTVTAGNLSVLGTIISGNIIPSANVSYTLGNATNQFAAAYLGASTLYLGTTQLGANNTANVATVNNNIIVTYSNGNLDITATGNVQAGNSVNTSNISLSGNVISALNVTSDVTASNLYAVTDVSAAGNVVAFNAVNTANLSLSGNVISTLNVTSNATANNINAVTNLSAGGNVVANNAVNTANLSLSGNVISTLNVTGNVNANNVNTSTNVSATGNVYGANFATTGAQGNITGANVISAITFSATGSAYANNVFASNVISAGGNVVTNQTFVGNALAGNTLTISSSAGGLTFSVVGNISAGNTYITTLPNPVNPNDAANKAYVDSVVSGLDVKVSSEVATTIPLANVSGVTNVVYNNGTAGVGATLTITTSSQLFIDGINSTTLGTGENARVLVKNELLVPTATSDAAWNGIYTVTSTATGAGTTVLTRATDFDNEGALGSIPGAFTFVQEGSTQAATGWICITNNPIVMGTTPIEFSQFSAAGQYTAGNGIDITGAVISTLYDGNTIGVNGSNELYVPANALFTTPNIGTASGNSLTVTGSLAGNIVQANTVSVTGNVLTTGLTAGNISITGNVVTNLNVTTDVTANNVYAINNFSAVGNITGGNISSAKIYDTSIGSQQIVFGNTDSSGLLSSASTLTTDGNNINAGGNVSAGGNVTAANFSTAGSGGNITGANVISGTTLTASGNVYGQNFITSNSSVGGNILTTGFISATGNITTAAFLFGDGYYISNINPGNVSSTKISNGGSFANIASANSNLVIAIGSSSNTVATFYDNGVDFGGRLSAVGNVLIGGLVSVNGNIVTSANINQTGTGNINGYNGYFSNNVTVVGTLQTTSNIIANIAGIFYGNTVNGNGAIYAGVPGFTPLASNVVVQFGGNVNSYSQVNFQNINNGTGASTDYIVTADNGTDSTYFGDFGIASSTHSDPDFFGDASTANDVYLYAVGTDQAGPSSTSGPGNLILGSTNGQIKLFVGNTAQANVIQQISSTGIAVTGNISSTSNISAGNTFLVDTTTNSMAIGTSATLTAGATLAINGSDSVLLPVGNIAQRPNTPATGMLRYNSTISQCEIWNGAAWVAVGGSTYTVITNEQFNGDGNTVAFTLGSSQTTDSCIVTINGVVQIPTTAYSVSGVYPTCVLTFTEAPEVGDTIDVREITTTTTVTAISNSPGNAIVSVSQTKGEVDITGNLVAQLNPSAPSLTNNSTMSFRLINNTTLAILVRGTDGTTRSANITLS